MPSMAGICLDDPGMLREKIYIYISSVGDSPLRTIRNASASK